MRVSLTDCREISIPLANFPLLLNASESQRGSYTISGGGSGLHWGKIDEDSNVENLILGIGDRTNPLMRKGP